MDPETLRQTDRKNSRDTDSRRWEKRIDEIRPKVSERYLAPVDLELFNLYKWDEKGYFKEFEACRKEWFKATHGADTDR
jgi:hypothetical protein